MFLCSVLIKSSSPGDGYTPFIILNVYHIIFLSVQPTLSAAAVWGGGNGFALKAASSVGPLSTPAAKGKTPNSVQKWFSGLISSVQPFRTSSPKLTPVLWVLQLFPGTKIISVYVNILGCLSTVFVLLLQSNSWSISSGV